MEKDIKLQPMEDNCLVELQPLSEHPTIIGEKAPENIFRQKIWQGKVLATGDGYIHHGEIKGKAISKHIPMTIQVGDTVLLPSHSAQLYVPFDDKRVLIRERDIYCRVDDKDMDIDLPRQSSYYDSLKLNEMQN